MNRYVHSVKSKSPKFGDLIAVHAGSGIYTGFKCSIEITLVLNHLCMTTADENAM